MTQQTTTPSVAATRRELTGKQVKQLRAEDKLPAVVYGHKQDSVNLVVPAREFAKIYQEAGSSTLLDLSIDGDKVRKVLVHEVQQNVLTGQLLHVDFYQVNMKEKLTTEIPLEFVGVSPAVEVDGGTLITAKSELNVECLPQDLVHSIEVDISTLVTFEDTIRVKDIKVPAGIEVLDEAEEAVASVAEPRSEEEMAALDEAIDGTVAVESETGNEPEATEEGKEA